MRSLTRSGLQDGCKNIASVGPRGRGTCMVTASFRQRLGDQTESLGATEPVVDHVRCLDDLRA